MEKLQRLDYLITKIEQLEKEIALAQLWKEAPNKKCLTIEEVAKWLGCTAESVRKYERQGILIARYPNAKKRYDHKDVNRFMEGYAPIRRRK